jgi:regulator of sigma E protease
MDTLISIVSFIVILGSLVLIHEIGHFIAAKLSGVLVEEFAIGMGPKLFSYKKGETIYKINLLPIGGYVKMLGEESHSSNPRSFSMQPIRKRLFIVTGGVIMNVVLAGIAYFIFLALNSFTLIMPVLGNYDFKFTKEEPAVIIDFVANNSPAEESGIEPGDMILAIDEISISSIEQLSEYIQEKKGTEVTLSVVNYLGGDTRDISLVPRKDPPEGEGSIGISMTEAVKISYEGINRIFSGLEHSFNMLSYTLVIFKDLIIQSFKTRDISYISETVSGPVGVYVVTDAVIKTSGLIGLLDIAGLMSTSLAFMNILPFPALDGGHVAILILEKVRGKKMNPNVENWLSAGGFFLLMAFMLVISVKDLIQYGVLDWLMFWK